MPKGLLAPSRQPAGLPTSKLADTGYVLGKAAQTKQLPNGVLASSRQPAGLPTRQLAVGRQVLGKTRQAATCLPLACRQVLGKTLGNLSPKGPHDPSA